MALLDFLKNKKDAEKSREKKPVRKTEPVKAKKEVKEKEVVAEKVVKSSSAKGFSYSIIKRPHISEKATDLSAKNNQYTFIVENSSNKIEIKKSVEGVYNVKVLSVNIITIPPKKRRVGRTQGFKKGFTKAVVTLKQGDKIEIL